MAGVRNAPRRFGQLCFAFSFAASHSAFVISTKPLPLQLFLPAQELLAVAQADLPLHEFTPSHFTFASSAARAASGAVLKTNAAAVASARPDHLFLLSIIDVVSSVTVD